MIKALALTLLTLAAVVFGLFLLILLPLMLVGLLLKGLVLLILLPLKLVGFVVGATGSVLFGLSKVLLAVGIGIVTLAVLGGALALLPLIPVLLVAFGLWFVFRLLQPRPVVRRAV